MAFTSSLTRLKLRLSITSFSRSEEKVENCSEPFINAVIAGLQASASSRPENAQAFLNLFPGCEDIKLD